MASVVYSGWRRFHGNFTLWTGLYLGKLVLAVLVALPALTVINTSVDNSAYAVPLLGKWSSEVLAEIVLTRPNVTPVFFITLLVAGLLAFLLKQFLNGGIYGSLIKGTTLNTREFFAASGAGFGQHLKISLTMVPIYLGLAIVAFVVVPVIPGDLFGHYADAAGAVFALRIILLYIIFILGGIFSDLARLQTSARPEQTLKETLRATFSLYRQQFVKLNSLYYLYFVPFVLIWILIEKLALVVTGGLANLIGVLLEMILFQICSWIRTGQSLLFTATTAGVVSSEVTAGSAEREVEKD